MFGIGFFEILIISAVLLFPVFIVVVVLLIVRSQRSSIPPNPNLYPCPDCQNLVSLRATTCPKCGTPLESK